MIETHEQTDRTDPNVVALACPRLDPKESRRSGAVERNERMGAEGGNVSTLPPAKRSDDEEEKREAAEAAADGGGSEDELRETVIVEGELGQLSMRVGGAKANESTVKLTGGAKFLPGQFEKGELVEFKVTGRVGAIKFEDTMDANTGDTIKTTREHTVKIVSITVDATD